MNTSEDSNKTEGKERYVLSEWACLFLTLKDYGIDTDHISGKVGQHIVDDFMELMAKFGYVVRDERKNEV